MPSYTCTYPVLIRLPTILKMPGATSRKAFADFIEAAQGDICVIPSEIFADIIKENQQRDEKLCKVLHRIAAAIETGEELKRNHFHALEMKIDQLIIAQNDTNTYETYMTDIAEKLTNLTEAVSRSSATVVERMDNEDNEKATNKHILKLKDLRGQYLRSEKTSELMEELLAKDNPYVQQKYRVKLSKDTHEDEITCYKVDAVNNAKREVKIMKVRMKRWEQEINILKTNIATILSKPSLSPEKKMKYEEQMIKNEESNTKEREEAVKKIIKTYEKDIKSGADQFLLKFTDETETAKHSNGAHDRSKNYSGGYRQSSFRKFRNRPPNF